jgi:hypothetical protein
MSDLADVVVLIGAFLLVIGAILAGIGRSRRREQQLDESPARGSSSRASNGDFDGDGGK